MKIKSVKPILTVTLCVLMAAGCARKNAIDSYVQLPDFKMHYIEQGAGDETLIFVHGFASTHRWWLPTFERLPENYHAYAIDIRAAGKSEQVKTGHTLAQYAEDIEAFATALGLEKFTLIGHSMGGGVSLLYALTHPERLKRLVLVDPLSPYGMKLDQGSIDWINSVQGQEEGQRAVVSGAFATLPEDDFMEQLVADAVAWGKPIYLGMMDDMAKFNVVDQLETMTMPTLITWGDKDGVIPFDAIVEAFEKIPDSSLEIWHGVGHSGPIEVPDKFISLLTQFMNEVKQPQ